jgi:hypothetical protein
MARPHLDSALGAGARLILQRDAAQVSGHRSNGARLAPAVDSADGKILEAAIDEPEREPADLDICGWCPEFYRTVGAVRFEFQDLPSATADLQVRNLLPTFFAY